MKWFNNLRIKSKLLLSYSIVTVFTIALATVAVLTINRIDDSYSYLLEFPQKRYEYLLRMESNCTSMRQATTAIVLNASNPEKIESYWNQFTQAYGDMISNAETYLERTNSDTVRDAAALKINADTIATIKKQLDSYYAVAERGMKTALTTSDMDLANPIFLEAAPFITEVVEIIKELLPNAAAYTVEASEQNTKEKDSAVLLLFIVLGVIVVFSVVIAFYISSLISNPLGMMAKALDQMGTKGDLELSPEMAKSAAECSTWKDEVGMCARAVGGLIEHLINTEKELGRIASGDLTVTIKTLSERDNIGQSVAKLADNLNSMFGEIYASTAQVSNGSKQIADGAQALAQGSTEQAASVEQLSSSISDIAEKTRGNAEMAEKAATLASFIMENAEKGSLQMDEMMTAVIEINQASQNINSVIKVIDDIAFQTNILALNAAVEAARAGQHGKGFAVVAEEVRSLAAKSAEAAKDTGELIANSMEKAELGARIAGETSASLTEIVAGINESTNLVMEIAKSSQEQAAGITQINRGIDQVAQVVQQNSATAEESAAASEEMSGQSVMLENLLNQFKLRGGELDVYQSGSPYKRLTMPDKYAYAPNEDSDGFGKY